MLGKLLTIIKNGEKKKFRDVLTSFIFIYFDDVTKVTRSARKYCKTGATLGQGDTQAHQAPSRGLNNLLKLL